MEGGGPVARVVSNRSLGIPFMSVTGHSRHIQQGVGLVSAKDFVLRMLAAEAPESALGSGGGRHHGEVGTKKNLGLTSSFFEFFRLPPPKNGGVFFSYSIAAVSPRWVLLYKRAPMVSRLSYRVS